MADDTRPCPECGSPTKVGTKFCGLCGADVRGSEPAPPPEAAVEKAAVEEEPAAQTSPPAPAGTDDKAAAKRAMKSTVLGMAPAGLTGYEQTETATSTRKAKSKKFEQTIFGVHPAGATPDVGDTIDESVTPERANADNPSSRPPSKPPPAQTNRTMLGVPAEQLAEARARAADLPTGGKPNKGPRPKPGPTDRTMLGVGTPAKSDGGAGRRRAEVKYTTADDLAAHIQARPRRRPTGLLVALVALALLVVGSVVVVLLATGGGSDVRVAVVQTDEGESLRVEVPGAAAGSRVRFAGEERLVEEGAVTFPMSADSLSIGDNELVLDVVDAEGSVSSSQVTLTVSYRVRVDIGPLSEDPPAVELRVEAVPGTEAVVDGNPVALDDEGSGSVRYELVAREGAGAFELDKDYRITLPGGDVEEGQVRTRIPFAEVQLDRPGMEVVTDRDSIEIAGVVHPEAQVTIDDAPIEVRGDRFIHSYALPNPGTYEPRVTVRRQRRAPRVVVLSIERVEDLAALAESFEPDPGMSYARIQQNPATYRGQRIVLEGRVYHVDVDDGRGVLQILVRDCPRGQRCPLWVTYPPAFDVSVESWVRVYGEVAGEQQFRSESDRVITVPRVDARFLLPAEAGR